MNDILAGIDIGGTKIGCCVGSAAGDVIASARIDNDRGLSPDELLTAALREIEGLVATAAAGRAPAALGVACPGPFLWPEGRFLEVPNMPRWQGFPVLEWLTRRSPWPVSAMNDANALVAAECRWGAAVGARVALFLTMSTGMGAGIAVDGVPLHGARGFAGEIGHLRLSEDGPVGFGKRGSVEGYLSGPGMVQVARAEALRCRQVGQATALDDATNGGSGAERLFELARSGDVGAVAAVRTIGARLGQLLAILADVFDPDVVALGTIGRHHHDLLLPPALEVLQREALPGNVKDLRVLPSTLVDHGNQAAVAAALSAR